MVIPSEDHEALLACASGATALCTIVGIEGSFSRRAGAQLAIASDGKTFGSLSDGCLERQLAADAEIARTQGCAQLLRYGKGSPLIDFRLPCGGGLDILIDPFPDRAQIHLAVTALQKRQAAAIDLPVPHGADNTVLRRRAYIPAPSIILLGEDPEAGTLARLAQAAGIATRPFTRRGAGQAEGLTLGQVPSDAEVDPWTAVVLLFHDHEWELAILRWALAAPAFFVGAQGGAQARERRRHWLAQNGVTAEQIARLRSPIGLIGRAREPKVLAISIMAEVIQAYELLQPHQ